MTEFVNLISALELTNKTSHKIAALQHYFTIAPAQDKIWVIALFTGRRPKRPVTSTLLKQWAIEESGIPEWLFVESYHNVGDLSETIALILPPPHEIIEYPLHQYITQLQQLHGKSDDEKREYILSVWRQLDPRQRFIFNKLISGNFRIGVSSQTLINALAALHNQESAALTHSFMGQWHPDSIDYDSLISGTHVSLNNSWPYPFCLAYALEGQPEDLGEIHSWYAEWKWDGIRGQIVKRNNEVYIWSRGEELVTEQFPELATDAENLPDGTVLDGEILAIDGNSVLSFNTLQKRLNRKNISRANLAESPIGFYCYDLLELDGNDIRQQPLSYRKSQLAPLIASLPASRISLSPAVTAANWQQLADYRQQARAVNSEGLMLKHVNSHYHAGRKKGDWWKWKINPYTVDAVLIYAQKGSGRRANFYTDYTFAIRNGDELVTIAKAYSGLTDAEIKEVDRFVKKNAVEKFGPVRTVKPQLVFEIAFEGIAESKRHKAGLALRFPRILRWRKDKTADEINTLQDLQQLLHSKP